MKKMFPAILITSLLFVSTGCGGRLQAGGGTGITYESNEYEYVYQNGVIDGVVTDKNGVPLEGIKIKIDYKKDLTSADGSYRLSLLPQGQREIKIYKDDKLIATRTVDITQNETLSLNIKLDSENSDVATYKIDKEAKAEATSVKEVSPYTNKEDITEKTEIKTDTSSPQTDEQAGPNKEPKSSLESSTDNSTSETSDKGSRE